LTVTEAVQQTGMPAAAIRRLLESGQVAGNRIGKVWRVSADSLAAWIHRTPSPSPVHDAKSFPEVEDRFA
jgi:excisionase family DNA binding protein